MGTILYGANREEVDFIAAQLVGARLSRANLSNSNLSAAFLNDPDLETPILRGASLEDPDLTAYRAATRPAICPAVRTTHEPRRRAVVG